MIPVRSRQNLKRIKLTLHSAKSEEMKIGSDLVVCGGDTGSSLSDEYLHYEDGSNHWTNVGTMKKARFSHSSVCIDGCLFTTGGCEPLLNVENDLDNVDVFSPGRWLDDEEWKTTSHHEVFSTEGGVKEKREMPIPLSGHTATIFGPHKIIVCGGSPTRYVNKSFSISLKY